MLKYLDPLMASLGSLVGSGSLQVQEMAVSAIGSLVIAAKSRFKKYFTSTMGVMLAFMKLTDETQLGLRARYVCGMLCACRGSVSLLSLSLSLSFSLSLSLSLPLSLSLSRSDKTAGCVALSAPSPLLCASLVCATLVCAMQCNRRCRLHRGGCRTRNVCATQL